MRPTLLACLLLASSCTVGPDYVRPRTATPLAFRELPAPPPGWAYAHPADGTGGGTWWATFADPTLSTLEARVTVNNQNIAAAAAAYDQARALIGEARAGLFPTIGASGSVSRTGTGYTALAPNGSLATHQTVTDAGNAGVQASWELDVWGRIRRNVEAFRANAASSAADLANARLSNQAALATLYFQLSYQDELTLLLRATVSAYQRTLDITTNQAQFGVAAPADVLTAQTQLDSAQSQLINAGVARAQDEHAIAALAGIPPTDLQLDPRRLTTALPAIPVALPSTLLQRRPDIAAAERVMAEQNANIGVAVAAYYPTISLSAVLNYAGSPIAALFDASHQMWSLAGAAAETLFEGGLRHAQVAAARAQFAQAVAQYRQTVLTAFQQVEDQLSTLRILAQQAEVQTRAVADAQRAVAIALNEYQAGTQTYTTVVQAQTILLSDQQTALLIQLDRLTASVALIQSLGGNWTTAQLPH